MREKFNELYIDGIPVISGKIEGTSERCKMQSNGFWVGAHGKHITSYVRVDKDEPETFPLRTTGCSRTGCMFCGFGCHLNNDQRFVMMKETHPKQYDYIMRPASQGGLNYKEVIDWLNEHGNLNIKY